jgi:hypothetical protein
MARVSLVTLGMGRWIGVFALAMTGFFMLFSRHGEAPVAQQAVDAPPRPASAGTEPGNGESAVSEPQSLDDTGDSVRIQHEVIRVTPPRQPASPPASPDVRRAFRSASVSPTTREPRFVERARRVLMGDGRYRPEPFPKPDTR